MQNIGKVNKLLIYIVFYFPCSVMAEQDADRLFAVGNWVAAADACACRTLDDPEDAVAWFQLARSVVASLSRVGAVPVAALG